MSVDAFINTARSYLGTPWRHRGRKPWALDCLGLVILSARNAGLAYEDRTRYGREPWNDELRQALRGYCGEPVDDWRRGDIALITWHRGEPTHLGVIADRPDGTLTLIHAHNLHGVIEVTLSGHIRDCITEVYRPWPRQY